MGRTSKKKSKRGWLVLQAAARFVARWEGFLPTAYLDELASPHVWTIGYGHTSAAGPPSVSAGDRVTEKQGKEILARDLRDAARTVGEAVDVPLTIRQRMALISIVFNCGPGVLDGTKIIEALNRKEYRAAADHFLEWSHAGGVVVQGLLNRRRAERWLMIHSLRPRSPHRPVPTIGKAHQAPQHGH